jgi:hypothetical protein
MWNLFNQRRNLEKEVFSTLRPGDLYGSDRRAGWQPEDLVRYLLMANVPGLTFFLIILTRIDIGSRAYEDFVSAVWLLGLGTAIAVGAWLLFRLSRSGESHAMAISASEQGAADLPPAARATMRRAATMKLLGFRVLIVSAISFCVGVYLGLKGFYLL